jgi:hypothetical protein
MRALMIVLLVLATGFDHVKHDGVANSALTCQDCHATTKTSLVKPGHGACFGKCHGPTPTLKQPAIDKRKGVCLSCHTEAALAGAVKQTFTQRPAATPEFQLSIGHLRHAAVACAQCHATKPLAPHVRCATCHVGSAGKGPPMSLCTGCHLPADLTQPAPDPRVLVRSAFSHPRHAARGPTGAKCATCHVIDSDARDLPHATKQMCSIAGCHDAKAAFPTTEACTRCHQDVPAIKFIVPRPDKPFDHTRHLPIVAFVACSTCHPIEKSGEVGLARHAQCASCHDDDFASRDPQTCGACHDATEPWRKLMPDRPSRSTTDFGTSLDHAKHPATCASCHKLTTPDVQLRPPRGHTACSGKSCHANAGGPAPSFPFCAGCHELGIAERRVADRVTAKWSARRNFVHACAACHLDMSGKDLLSIATPPKSTCAPCHNGVAAFKLTGTTCKRCHR